MTPIFTSFILSAAGLTPSLIISTRQLLFEKTQVINNENRTFVISNFIPLGCRAH